jgi:hypothetical protein
VAGYNIYRSSRPGRDYIQLNTMPLDTTEYIDRGIADQRVPAFTEGTTYYYTVTAVDADGDQSPRSAEISPTLEPAETGDPARSNSGDPDSGNETTGSSGGGAVCFVSAVQAQEASLFIGDWPTSTVLGVLALIGLLWLGRRKRG